MLYENVTFDNASSSISLLISLCFNLSQQKKYISMSIFIFMRYYKYEIQYISRDTICYINTKKYHNITNHLDDNR